MSESLDHDRPSEDSARCVETAEQYLRQGEPMLAYNTVQAGLAKWPRNVRLRQLGGLSAARVGDTLRANRLLSDLFGEGACDAETLGMLARTYKDIALRARNPETRDANLKAAFRIYARAYESALDDASPMDACYTGINAATVAVLKGELALAQRIARQVREMCLRTMDKQPGVSDYWLEATVGEAALILGDEQESIAHYRCAANLARGRFGDLATTRRQAAHLSRYMGRPSEWIAHVLVIPPVVMFTGHMMDEPSRVIPRLPRDMEGVAAAAIRSHLGAINPVAAYGSAACGADILYLEALRSLGSEIHIVLPFPPQEFRRTSVDIAPGDWGIRFESLINHADSVTITSDYRAHDSAATFEYANLVLTGMAVLRAQTLGTELRGLAFWDEKPNQHGGGTASLVRLWQSREVVLEKIRLATADTTGGSGPALAFATGSEMPAVTAFSHEIRSMLFADVAGYSSLSEDQTLIFIERFLGAVGKLISESPDRPEHVETTGDGLYMVFESTDKAGHFALALQDLVTGTNWAECGLPAGTAIRIALHSGPVYCGRNPVTGAALYTGPHTSRTARIEPITPPGQVYASSAFAAVAAASGRSEFSMQYIGKLPLAKGYGLMGLYHLSQSTDSGSRL